MTFDSFLSFSPFSESKKKLKVIQLSPGMVEDLSKYLPLKTNSIGISYGFEGSLDHKNRQFSAKCYDLAEEAYKLRFTTNDDLEAKVFQTIEKDGL